MKHLKHANSAQVHLDSDLTSPRTVVAEVVVRRGDGPLDNGGLMQEATTEDMVLKVLRQYITICGTDSIVEAESSITLGHNFDYKVVQQHCKLKIPIILRKFRVI